MVRARRFFCIFSDNVPLPFRHPGQVDVCRGAVQCRGEPSRRTRVVPGQHTHGVCEQKSAVAFVSLGVAKQLLYTKHVVSTLIARTQE